MLGIPKEIYSVDSPYNGKITVWEKGSERVLSVENITQSVSHDTSSVSKRVWGKLVALVKNQQPEAKNILLLGLAGGTMPHLFATELPGAHITAIEIDKVMIDVAEEYFGLKTLQNLSVINADAFGVIASPTNFSLDEKSFDVAIVDFYHGDKYPELADSGSFLSGLRKLLKPAGLAVFNRIYLAHHQEEVNSFKEKIGLAFEQVQSALVAGRSNSDNILIYGRS